jgi:hypothetical protein
MFGLVSLVAIVAEATIHTFLFIYLFICSTNVAKKAQSGSLLHHLQLFENRCRSNGLAKTQLKYNCSSSCLPSADSSSCLPSALELCRRLLESEGWDEHPLGLEPLCILTDLHKVVDGDKALLLILTDSHYSDLLEQYLSMPKCITIILTGMLVLAVCAIQLNGQTDRAIRTVRITIRTQTVAIPQ